MDRVVEPLKRMGAQVEGTGRLPLRIAAATRNPPLQATRSQRL